MKIFLLIAVYLVLAGFWIVFHFFFLEFYIAKKDDSFHFQAIHGNFYLTYHTKNGQPTIYNFLRYDEDVIRPPRIRETLLGSLPSTNSHRYPSGLGHYSVSFPLWVIFIFTALGTLVFCKLKDRTNRVTQGAQHRVL
jgi:hypothetical protein